MQDTVVFELYGYTHGTTDRPAGNCYLGNTKLKEGVWLITRHGMMGGWGQQEGRGFAVADTSGL